MVPFHVFVRILDIESKNQLKKLYHESKKKESKSENGTCVRRSLVWLSEKTAIDSIIKNKMIQEDTSECKKESSQIINDIGRNIVYLRNLSDGK